MRTHLGSLSPSDVVVNEVGESTVVGDENGGLECVSVLKRCVAEIVAVVRVYLGGKNTIAERLHVLPGDQQARLGLDILIVLISDLALASLKNPPACKMTPFAGCATIRSLVISR
jgi:hypothetical protein